MHAARRASRVAPTVFCLLLLVVLACRDASWPGGARNRLTLAAGPPESAAACVARAYTSRLNEEASEYRAGVLSTNGAVESLVAVRDGSAELAVATADSLAQAVNGEGPFSGQTVSARTIAALYETPVYLLAPASSSLNGLSQIRGSRAGMGPAGSGMELTVRRVLGAAHLESRVSLDAMPWEQLLERLEAGTLPAVFWVDGSPSPALERAARLRGKRFRALNTASVVPLLQQRYGETLYSSLDLPLGTPFDSPRAGLASVQTVLVSRQDLPDQTAFAATSALLRLAPSLARECEALAGWSAHTATRPQPAALHAGAALFYREKRR